MSGRWNPFRFDRRSLALFRVLFGLTLLYDVVDRARDLTLFYSGQGVPSPDFVRNYLFGPYKFSFHLLSGNPSFEALLFVIHAAAVLCFILGYRARRATFVAWVLFISVQARNYAIHQASDTLLCQMLFFSLFLPLDARDLSGSDADPTTVSPGTIAYAIFFPSVLFLSALFKIRSPLWLSGMGVQAAFTNDFHAGRLAVALSHSPNLVHWLNYGTLVSELLLPVLLLFSVGRIRHYTMGMLAFFFASLGACLILGEFPVLLLVGLVPYLGTEFWERVTGRTAPRTTSKREMKWGWNYLALAGLTFITVVQIDLVYHWFRVPRHVFAMANSFHLVEEWSMFSQRANFDGWFIVEGHTRDGRAIDLLTGKEVAVWQRPAVPSESYKNQRWLKFFQGMIYRPQFASFFGHAACARSPIKEPISSVVIILQRKRQMPADGGDYYPQELFYQSNCT
jgi:hypothetical protein